MFINTTWHYQFTEDDLDIISSRSMFLFELSDDTRYSAKYVVDRINSEHNLGRETEIDSIY